MADLNKLALSVEDDKFNDAQKEYIRKYAAGLLLAWAGPAVHDHITPDTMDGFEPSEDIFPDQEDDGNDLLFEGGNEVGHLLDVWLNEIAKLAGFTSVADAYDQMPEDGTVYMKYPVLPKS